jgi:predicted DNA-binding transcriptional regulator AlpA
MSRWNCLRSRRAERHVRSSPGERRIQLVNRTLDRSVAGTQTELLRFETHDIPVAWGPCVPARMICCLYTVRHDATVCSEMLRRANGPRRNHMSKRQGTRHRDSSEHGADPLAGDRLVSEAETAALLGIAQRTLQEWRRKGAGPAFIRLTRRSVRYRPADVLAWVTDRLRQGAR